MHKHNRKPNIVQMSVAAICIVLNLVGAYAALCLKLPVYMDSVGTIAGAMLGPWYGMVAGFGSAFISGITTDIYTLYFMLSNLFTGLMAGILFQTALFRTWGMPVGAALLALPGATLSGMISAYVFGGVTSSGSSILVQLLKHLGCNLAASAIVVQMVTEYGDRLISSVFVMVLLSCMTVEMKMRIRGEYTHERYNVIHSKNPREIVLLKGFPCAWGNRGLE